MGRSYGILPFIWDFFVIQEFQISIGLSIGFSYGDIHHMGFSYGNCHHLGLSNGNIPFMGLPYGILRQIYKISFSYGKWFFIWEFEISLQFSNTLILWYDDHMGLSYENILHTILPYGISPQFYKKSFFIRKFLTYKIYQDWTALLSSDFLDSQSTWYQVIPLLRGLVRIVIDLYAFMYFT